MAELRLLSSADNDITVALSKTIETFGFKKYQEYALLIEEALETLTEDPRRGRKRPDISPGTWLYPIGKRGRRARHVFLYRILEEGEIVEVFALPYDGMNLPDRFHPLSQNP